MNNADINTLKQLLHTAATLLDQADALLTSAPTQPQAVALYQRPLTSSGIASHYRNMTASTLNIDLQQAGVITRMANNPQQWCLTPRHDNGQYVQYQTRYRADGTTFQVLYWTVDGQRLIVDTLQRCYGLTPVC